MKSSLKNIFKTIFQLNAESIKAMDPLVYGRIKFEEALENISELRENALIQVKDSFGREKTRELDSSGNILKAAQLHGHLKSERASDLFVNLAQGDTS